MAKILIIDDEADLLRALTMIIKSRGHQVTSLSEAVTATKLVQQEKFDLIISDIRMQPMDGLQFLEFLRQKNIATPIVMLTAYATLDTALQTIKNGAFDFITKPFKPEAIIELVQQVLEQPVMDGSDISVEPELCRQWLRHEIAARSYQMKDVCASIEQIAPTNETVIISGEEGTGKRFIAETIQVLSPRSARPFQAVDCAALPEKDLHELLCKPGTDAADIYKKNTGGTILLENVDCLPANVGKELADIIQSKTVPPAARPFDVRFLASCRKKNESMAWILPLAAFTVSLPALRERPQDLLPLISFFISKYAAEHPAPTPGIITADAYNILTGYMWPGNADELRNILYTAIPGVKNRKLTGHDLPASLSKATAEPARNMPQFLRIEELRGKSFRNYVRRKQVEMKQGTKAEGT